MMSAEKWATLRHGWQNIVQKKEVTQTPINLFLSTTTQSNK